jgi:hypothetical protein
MCFCAYLKSKWLHTYRGENISHTIVAKNGAGGFIRSTRLPKSYDEERKGKAIAVTGHGGPQSCETLRLPHFLDNQFIDVGEVVSLTRRLPLTPR